MLGALVLAVGLAVAPSAPKPVVHSAAPLAFVLRVLGYAAHDVGLDIRLLRSVARHESGYASNAVSKTGAVGVLQLEPGTALDRSSVVAKFVFAKNTLASCVALVTLT